MAKGDKFAVLTMDKQKGNAGGLSAHIDRVVYDAHLDRMVPFRPKSVRDDSRTVLNRECIEIASKVGRTQAIWNRLKEEGFSKEDPDKKETKGKKKTRKIKEDAVIALCFICTSDEDTMKQLEADGKLDEWIDATIDWFRKEFGRENVVSAVLHMDETTPHLHITVVPITHEPPKPRMEKPKFDEQGNPIRKYETDERGNIILDEKGRATVKKRAYKKQEVTARLAAKDLCHPLAMSRWQTQYAVAMAPFGLKRGIEGSKQKRVPPAEWNLQQVNGQLMAVEKEVARQEAVKTTNNETIATQHSTITTNNKVIEEQETTMGENAIAIEEGKREKAKIEQSVQDASKKLVQAEADLEKWGAILIDEKTLEYPSLTEMEFDDGCTFGQLFTDAVNNIVAVINKPVGTALTITTQKQWRAQKVKDVKAIITDLQTKLFGANGIDYAHKKAITAFGKDLYCEAKAAVAHILIENEQMKEKIEMLETEKATIEGDYTLVKASNKELNARISQLTSESQGYQRALEHEKLAWHDNGTPVKWTNGKQLTKADYQKWLLEQFEKKKKELEEEKRHRLKEFDEHRKSEQAHKRHMKEIKDMILAIFTLNAKKVIQIIIDHWKKELKEFSREVMNDLKTLIFGAESTMSGRKTFVSDAFVWAKVFAELDENKSDRLDYSMLEPLREDAMRIADGTWDSYREELARKEKRGQLLQSAIAAVVEMGNCSYQRHLNQTQADTMEAFLLFDGGDRKQLCDEIWAEAEHKINSGWRRGAHKALEELRTGELYGKNYSKGLNI